MLQHQHDGVLEVLQVDLDDLHLFQQQVGRRDGRAVEIEPVLEGNPVAEIELVGEDVDIEAGLPMQIGVAGAFRRHIDAFVGHISARHQKLAYRAVLLSLGAKIHVREHALGIFEQVQIVGALEPIGDRPQNAEANAFGLRIADEAQRFIHEFQIETWICRHLSHTEPPQSACRISCVERLVAV